MNITGKASSEREKLKNLRGPQKLRYIWDYYKLPLAAFFIAVYIIGYSVYGHVTHKEVVLSAALVNISANEALTAQLSAGFLDDLGENPAKNTVRLYTGLYLTDDEINPYHEYTYASRMKILAAIDGRQLDIVLMNREAFDAFSQNGYLCDLKELLSDTDTALYQTLKPYLVTNTVILEDNSTDLQLDPSVTYQAVTKECPVGLDLSQAALIADAGFNDTVYLGIIQNSSNKSAAIQYLQYLFY